MKEQTKKTKSKNYEFHIKNAHHYTASTKIFNWILSFHLGRFFTQFISNGYRSYRHFLRFFYFFFCVVLEFWCFSIRSNHSFWSNCKLNKKSIIRWLHSTNISFWWEWIDGCINKILIWIKWWNVMKPTKCSNWEWIWNIYLFNGFVYIILLTYAYKMRCYCYCILKKNQLMNSVHCSTCLMHNSKYELFNKIFFILSVRIQINVV